MSKIETHLVQIVCPECNHGQVATVEHTFPFYTYIHTCTNCNYLILESEFNIIEEEKNETPQI